MCFPGGSWWRRGGVCSSRPASVRQGKCHFRADRTGRERADSPDEHQRGPTSAPEQSMGELIQCGRSCLQSLPFVERCEEAGDHASDRATETGPVEYRHRSASHHRESPQRVTTASHQLARHLSPHCQGRDVISWRGNSDRLTGHWSLARDVVTRHWSLVTGHWRGMWSLVTGHQSLVRGVRLCGQVRSLIL